MFTGNPTGKYIFGKSGMIHIVMKNAIILHGMPDKEEYLKSPHQTTKHWIPWVREHLGINNIPVDVPELPEPYKPNYKAWKKVFEESYITEDTQLIGHSAGAGFLVRWLSENKVQVGRVVLVAPWLDTEKHLKEKFDNNTFFDFTIDPDFPSRTESTTIFVSNDDEGYIHDSVALLQDVCPGIQIKKFKDKGHFTLDDMGTPEFPELVLAIVE